MMTGTSTPQADERELLIRATGVGKIFCRDLKISLIYGFRDAVKEFFPFLGGGKTRALHKSEFWAARDISFELERGECLGLVGHNGAGKTTLLRMLNGLIKPDSGSITMRGRIGALIALGAGFNPILTGRENVYVNGAILGMSAREIDERMEEIIEFSELREFIDSPVQNYSSGMVVRLGFAVATSFRPDILLIDEVIAVGDARFRWKCLARIRELTEKKVSIILVSHNPHDLMRVCTKGLLLDHGRMVAAGNIRDVLQEYEKIRPSGENLQEHAASHAASIRSVRMEPRLRTDGLVSGILLKIEVEARCPVAKARLVIGLTHSEAGPLFHLSSFRDLEWIRLDEGVTLVEADLSGFIPQRGTCRTEISLRGERLDEILDTRRGDNQLQIDDPLPNYEGFGENGAIHPEASWTIHKPPARPS